MWFNQQEVLILVGRHLVMCTQMVLKVHNVDGSTKMVAIHESMNSRDVCILLAERNHQEIGPNWTLVEKLTDLHLGRRFTWILIVCQVDHSSSCIQNGSSFQRASPFVLVSRTDI